MKEKAAEHMAREKNTVAREETRYGIAACRARVRRERATKKATGKTVSHIDLSGASIIGGADRQSNTPSEREQRSVQKR